MSQNTSATLNQETVKANRAYFDQNAMIYDADEPCMVESRSQEIVAEHLRRLVSCCVTSFPDQSLRALDAGGGSGNVAIKLIALGVRTDLVDVSQEMCSLYLSKLTPGCSFGQVVCSDVSSFLSLAGGSYHLICFSSVLHHLADYKSVIDLAVERLLDGGIVYTVHDPCIRNRFWHKVEMADYHLSSFSRFWRYIRYKFGGKAKRVISTETLHCVDVNPEPHGMSGIDDYDLRQHFEKAGLQIVWHERYKTARTWLGTVLYWAANRARGFSFAVQKQPF